nr:MAG TPA: hypothetical protein [Caudoviricetes sp.]
MPYFVLFGLGTPSILLNFYSESKRFLNKSSAFTFCTR